jgi:hypothetical protein
VTVGDLGAALDEVVGGFAPEDQVWVGEYVSKLRFAGAATFDDLLALPDDARLPPDIRRIACWMLARLHDQRAGPVLVRALGSEQAELQAEAASAIGLLPSDEGVDPLVNRLRGDPVVFVREAAAYGLGLLAVDGALGALVGAMNDRREIPSVRGTAAEALSHFGAEAVEPLIEALKDDSAEVRFWAAFSLGELGDPGALPELARVASTDTGVVEGWGTVRKEAADAINTIEGRLLGQDAPGLRTRFRLARSPRSGRWARLPPRDAGPW